MISALSFPYKFIIDCCIIIENNLQITLLYNFYYKLIPFQNQTSNTIQGRIQMTNDYRLQTEKVY